MWLGLWSPKTWIPVLLFIGLPICAVKANYTGWPLCGPDSFTHTHTHNIMALDTNSNPSSPSSFTPSDILVAISCSREHIFLLLFQRSSVDQWKICSEEELLVQLHRNKVANFLYWNLKIFLNERKLSSPIGRKWKIKVKVLHSARTEIVKVPIGRYDGAKEYELLGLKIVYWVNRSYMDLSQNYF